MQDTSSSAGPSDPFAGLPPPQAAKLRHEGGANDLLSVSMFDGLSSGKPSPRSFPPNLQVLSPFLAFVLYGFYTGSVGFSCQLVCMSTCSLSAVSAV